MQRKPKPISLRRSKHPQRLLGHIVARRVGRHKATLLFQALVVRPPAEILAAATHTAQPVVARQSQAVGAPQATDLRHLRAHLEVEAEAIPRLRRRPLKM